MPDVKKVLTGLECLITNEVPCEGCPYNGSGYCMRNIAQDARELLKEQEPVELIDDGDDFVSIGDRMEITHRWKCGGCGHFVVYCETRPKIKFCHLCGREFKSPSTGGAMVGKD